MKFVATYFRHYDEICQHPITAEDYASAVIQAESLLQEGEHVVVRTV